MAIAVIPARYHSTRFPGKPLADETGKPMICHVVDRAAAARRVERVIVATDDDRIAQAVNQHTPAPARHGPGPGAMLRQTPPPPSKPV